MKTSCFRIDFIFNTNDKNDNFLSYSALSCYLNLLHKADQQLGNKLEKITDEHHIDGNIITITLKMEEKYCNSCYLGGDISYLDEIHSVIFNNFMFYQLRGGEYIYKKDKFFKQNIQSNNLIETNEYLLEATINIYNKEETRKEFVSLFNCAINSGDAPKKIIVSNGKQIFTEFSFEDINSGRFPDSAAFFRMQRKKPNSFEKATVKFIEKTLPAIDFLEEYRKGDGVTNRIADFVLPKDKSEEELKSPKNLLTSLLKGTVKGILGGIWGGRQN